MTSPNLKSNQFEPEIGQMVFGQPFKEFSVPEYVHAALSHIREEVSRVEWNNRQEQFDPFSNSGHKYKNEVFEANAYSWNEEVEQPYNFKWKDLEISWYKYLGRGMSMNRETTPKEIAEMIDECLIAARENEKDLLSNPKDNE